MKLSLAKLPEILSCPTSKTHAARALILGSLKKESVKIIDLPQAQDTLDLLAVLTNIGLKIKINENEMIILNSFPACEVKKNDPIDLFLGEGGTTIRFLIPFLSLGKNKYHLKFSGRMNERPMDEIYLTLSTLGVFCEKTHEGVNIQGPIDSEKMASIDCDKSSQFASGFEMLKLYSDHKIEYQNLTHSLKYFEITKKLIEHFQHNNEYTVPADFSGLGYLVAYGVLNQKLKVQNVFEIDDDQADSKIFEVLEMIGADFKFTQAGLEINKSDHFKAGMIVDGSTCIDLVPTLCFLAAYIPFPSTITNISKLQYKESDRLVETLNILKVFKVDFSYDPESDILQIKGGTKRVLAMDYETRPDHRMIMLVSLFLKNNAGGSVEPSLEVRKSFPDFFSLFS